MTLKKFRAGNKKISVQYQYGTARPWHSFFVDSESEAIERVKLIYSDVEIVQCVDNSHEITQKDLRYIANWNKNNGFDLQSDGAEVVMTNENNNLCPFCHEDCFEEFMEDVPITIEDCDNLQSFSFDGDCPLCGEKITVHFNTIDCAIVEDSILIEVAK